MKKTSIFGLAMFEGGKQTYTLCGSKNLSTWFDVAWNIMQSIKMNATEIPISSFSHGNYFVSCGSFITFLLMTRTFWALMQFFPIWSLIFQTSTNHLISHFLQYNCFIHQSKKASLSLSLSRKHTHKHARTYTHTYIHGLALTSMHTNTHTRTHSYVHTQRTHTHTYKETFFIQNWDCFRIIILLSDLKLFF